MNPDLCQGASRRAELPKAQAEELRAALKKLEAHGVKGVFLGLGFRV